METAKPPGDSEAEVPLVDSAERSLDPVEFFQSLVERYRRLTSYRDSARLVQVRSREGVQGDPLATELLCEVANGELQVRTPVSRLAPRDGAAARSFLSPALREARQRYDLWLAPHMALKFAPEPLKNLRAGVQNGFSASQAEHVTIENKTMVHLELKNAQESIAEATAKLDLYVNPESMLIERVEGSERLPDGDHLSTVLQITPEYADGEVARPAAPAQPATRAPASGASPSAAPPASGPADAAPRQPIA